MSVLKEIYDYLRKIKNNEVSFQYLLNKGFKDLDDKVSFIIKDSLKSIVNKYYFLCWELDRIYKCENSGAKDFLVCALGQYHFVKEVSNEMLLGYLKEDLSQIDDKISVSEFYDSMLKLDNKVLTLTEKENEIVIKKMAVSYSYPERVCKMMCKHFGVKRIFKSVASSRKNGIISLNCNSFLTSVEQLTNKYPNLFVGSEITDHTLRYIGKEKLIDLDVFKNNYVFVESEISQLLVNKLNLDINDNILLIADDRGTIALDMMIRIKDVGQVNVMCNNVINYNSTFSLAKRFKLHSLNCFQSNIDCLLTHIEKESCDKVLLIAPSSNLGLVRKQPDVLLKFDIDKLDSIIEEQKKQLLEASTFVNKGGLLEYAVFTYDKKESFLIIEEFLNNNTDFTLIEEKQIFGYEISGEGVYYAIMKKN